MASTERPSFHGLAVHRNLKLRFSLLYPEGWSEAPAPRAAGGGAVLSPDPDDRHTYVLIQGRKLPSAVTPEDLDALREGLLDGVGQLPDASLQEQKAEAVGPLLDVEARHTYRDAETAETRRRWLRLLCQGSVQVSLVCQGSSAERFEYWLPMFNTIMRTVQFADWWAESTGHSWRKTVNEPID